MTKKLATAAGSVAVVAAAIAMTAGTYSYFNDDAVAGPNSIKVGTLKITLGGNAQTAPLNALNVAPGASPNSKQLEITNAGSLPGELSLKLVKDSDTENECGSASERAADPTCGLDNTGELGSEMIVVVYDPSLRTRLRSSTVNRWGSAVPLDMGTLAPGATRKMPIATWINSSVGNKIQSDGVRFHFEVRLDQA